MVIVGVSILAFIGWESEFLAPLRENLTQDKIAAMVESAGVFGPIMVVLLMVVAVVASPLPSAPIALVAGALYGHSAGTVIVAVGAEIGALMAFAIARVLGREAIQKRFGKSFGIALLGSQNKLMGIVFISRMLPFLSFDMVSYAAGLTQLQTWRFALATFAGIIPASFFLAHFGDEIVNSTSASAMLTALALGMFTGLPLLIIALRQKSKSRRVKCASGEGVSHENEGKGR